jgi:hypothetical protein
VIWAIYFAQITGTKTKFNWTMVLSFSSAIVLLSIFVLTIVLFFRKSRLGWGTLALGLIFSTSLFTIDIKCKNFQMQRPFQHVGTNYSDITIGYRYDYFNWWWYEDVQFLGDKAEESHLF